MILSPTINIYLKSYVCQWLRRRYATDQSDCIRFPTSSPAHIIMPFILTKKVEEPSADEGRELMKIHICRDYWMKYGKAIDKDGRIKLNKIIQSMIMNELYTHVNALVSANQNMQISDAVSHWLDSSGIEPESLDLATARVRFYQKQEELKLLRQENEKLLT